MVDNTATVSIELDGKDALLADLEEIKEAVGEVNERLERLNELASEFDAELGVTIERNEIGDAAHELVTTQSK